ncbi:hypothetical protein FN846DRAFT_902548 [Sphaerosporella brunnea]|uniref:HNH domain-containing protein n=1 Tax=Sphaerosporella brunnea TaxID=1250544 RepID=A0A5J5F9K7_9PEZI|nr:hypothetical protein FN846DRAFT_902548 [Sphaerosporella brunnea]
MASNASAQASTNFALLRECLSLPILRQAAQPASSPSTRRAKRKQKSKNPNSSSTPAPEAPTDDDDATELADFIDYLSTELFSALPGPLQTLTAHTTTTTVATPADFPPHLLDTLRAYTTAEPEALLRGVVAEYTAAAQAPPPVWSRTRPADGRCQMCARAVPLTYHHLFPREVHDKAVRRGWCAAKAELGRVAWVCRPCHDFVHRLAPNEELARDWNTLDALMAREDVASWRRWVGRQR